MSKPSVSVLMSVYNGEHYLQEAVESVLQQTYTDYEFIIIEDGSRDDTWAILTEYASRDQRVVLVQNQENLGLTKSLNLGLTQAKGKYIARQDADDISLPSRLACQVDFLEKNPEIGVVGTQMEIMDESENKVDAFSVPCSHSMIAWTLLFDRSFAHPSVVMRKEVLDQSGGYNASFKVAQDHELWTRLVELTRFANLSETLVRYRTHEDAICRKRAAEQSANVLLARQQIVSRVTGKEFPLEVFAWLKRSQSKKEMLSDGQIKKVIALIMEAYTAFQAKDLFIDNEQGKVYEDLQNRILTASRSTVPFIESLSRYELLGRYWRSLIPDFVMRVAEARRAAMSLLQQTLPGKRLRNHRQGNEIPMGVDGDSPDELPTVKEKEEGISIIILSYERLKQLSILLNSLLKQDLDGMEIELILCNNSARINLSTSSYSNIGRLLRKFDNVKIFNSNYNWRCGVRYAIATLAKYTTVLFLDDDLFLLNPHFICYMFDHFRQVEEMDIISCWNTLWLEQNDDYFCQVSMTFLTPEITELTESDTGGPGICMFNKKILFNPGVWNVIRSTAYPLADDMAFSIIAAMECGSRTYFLPSYRMLKFQRTKKKTALNQRHGHYKQLYNLFKSLFKSGYKPVLSRLSDLDSESYSAERKAAQILPKNKNPW
jgi:glycosyltransferase involved in cell wall biosynthesis